jgi:hypothetical protein
MGFLSNDAHPTTTPYEHISLIGCQQNQNQQSLDEYLTTD